MKMVHGLKTLLLTLSLLVAFEGIAKTLEVDTVTPSVTDGDFTITPNGTGDIVVGSGSADITLDTTGDVVIGNSSNDITLDATGDVTIGSLTGLIEGTAGVLSGGATVALTSQVTGVLPVANGGTGNSTGLFLTVTKSSTGNIAATGEDNVLADSSGGDITLTLPAVSGNSGLTYKISKSTDGNKVTIEGNGSETIGGELNVVMATKYDSIIITTNGTAWFYLSDDVSYGARYTTDAGLAIGASPVDVKYEDKDYDTHDAYNTVTGIYTFPIDGKYYFCASLSNDGTDAYSTSQNVNIDVTAASVEVGRDILFGNGNNFPMAIESCGIVDVSEGDTMKVDVQSSVTSNLRTDSKYNTFSVQRFNQ